MDYTELYRMLDTPNSYKTLMILTRLSASKLFGRFAIS
jgi:hypothetical protein